MSPTHMSGGQKIYNLLKVDQVMAQAENADAKIIRAAQASAYEGYAGYVQDLETSSRKSCLTPSSEVD